MKNQLLASASLFALAAVAPALGADLRTPMPVKAQPAPPVFAFSWTGCYIGANVGGGWGRKEFRDVGNGYIIDASGIHTLQDDVSGVVGGGQVGCDYQVAANWVIGIEGQGAAAGISGSVSNPFGLETTFHAKTDWLASVTGRAGYSFDRTLIYVKGGAAWAGDKYNADYYGAYYSASETRSGWTLGGGLEWAFANGWSAKLEYAHYDFGTRSVLFARSPTITSFESVGQRIDTFILGINYRFGTGAVATRY
jgi:outer membrane immunogenic protein